MTTDATARKALPHDNAPANPSTNTTAKPPRKSAPKKGTSTAAGSLASSRANTPNPTSSQPNDPNQAVRQCKHCKKFVPAPTEADFKTHSKLCLREKKERKRQKEEAARRGQEELDRAEAGLPPSTIVGAGTTTTTTGPTSEAGSSGAPPNTSNTTTANGNTADAEGDTEMPDSETITTAKSASRNPLTTNLAKSDTTRGNTPALADGASTTNLNTTDPTKPQPKKPSGAQNKKRKAEEALAAAALGIDPSSIKPPPQKKKKTKASGASATDGNNNSGPNSKSGTHNPTTTGGANSTGAGGTGGTTGGGTTTTTKPKGPVDVERQCGVLIPGGGMCARSLTCKSHSMGSKRAVPGRSAPYDILLAQYQKRNQARVHREKVAMMRGMAGGEWGDEDGLGDNEGGVGGRRVDSEEEREAVMAGVGRMAPRPLVGVESLGLGLGGGGGGPSWLSGASGAAAAGAGTTALSLGNAGMNMNGYASAWRSQPIRARYQHIRMKEMLSNALGGSRGGNLFAVPDKVPERDRVPQDRGPDRVSDRRDAPAGDMEAEPAGSAAGTSRKASMGPPPARSGSGSINV